MVIYEYPKDRELNIHECVLALGFFDGVHIAHRDLLRRAREVAEQRGLTFGVFTFASKGNIKEGHARLYDDTEKAEIFSSLGADFTLFADFSAISGCSPEEFVTDILCKQLNCRVCVAGFNFRFGKGAKAGSAELSSIMSEAGGEAIICEEITAGDNTTLSATMIRGLILEGRISEANELLGVPYYIKGRVLHGRSDGRKMGFPTVNIPIEEGKIVPRLGVYRSAIPIDGKIYIGITNIGVCPTFECREVHLETHILDFDGDLYGKEIRIYLLDFMREERAFSSQDELKMQITIDKNTAIEKNGDITWQDLGLK